MNKENYFELIKQNIAKKAYDGFCVFMSKDVVESLSKDCYGHVEFTSRGMIYYDEDVNEYVTYIYNRKANVYMILEASFNGVTYKAPKLTKESPIIRLGEVKKTKNCR